MLSCTNYPFVTACWDAILHLLHLFLSFYIFSWEKKNPLIYVNLSLLCMDKLWAASIFMSHLSLDLLPNSIYLLSLPHSIQNTFPPQEDYTLNLPSVSNKSDK